MTLAVLHRLIHVVASCGLVSESPLKSGSAQSWICGDTQSGGEPGTRGRRHCLQGAKGGSGCTAVSLAARPGPATRSPARPCLPWCYAAK